MLGGIGIREIDGLLQVLDEYQTAIVECLSGNLLTRQLLKLTVEFCLHIEYELFGVGDEQHLRVTTMFSL